MCVCVCVCVLLFCCWEGSGFDIRIFNITCGTVGYAIWKTKLTQFRHECFKFNLHLTVFIYFITVLDVEFVMYAKHLKEPGMLFEVNIQFQYMAESTKTFHVESSDTSTIVAVRVAGYVAIAFISAAPRLAMSPRSMEVA